MGHILTWCLFMFLTMSFLLQFQVGTYSFLVLQLPLLFLSICTTEVTVFSNLLSPGYKPYSIFASYWYSQFLPRLLMKLTHHDHKAASRGVMSVMFIPLLSLSHTSQTACVWHALHFMLPCVPVLLQPLTSCRTPHSSGCSAPHWAGGSSCGSTSQLCSWISCHTHHMKKAASWCARACVLSRGSGRGTACCTVDTCTEGEPCGWEWLVM